MYVNFSCSVRLVALINYELFFIFFFLVLSFDVKMFSVYIVMPVSADGLGISLCF